MNWDKEIAAIYRRRKLAQALGGQEGVTRQHAQGRLTVRERLEKLLDADSFREQGRLAGAAELDDDGEMTAYTPANYVLGFGRIDERPVVVGGEDFTLRGGSPNAAGLRKSVAAEHLAVRHRMPLVRLLEGGGGSVDTSRSDGKKSRTVGEPIYAAPRFAIIAQAMAQVPVVSAALGPVAGFPAGRLVASHFSVMVRGLSQVMVGGPALVKRALGQTLSKEALGGAAVHATSGVVDNVVDSEEEAFAAMRRFLSYLPQHVCQRTAREVCVDPTDRCAQELATIIPRNRRHAFDIEHLLELVVDQGSLFVIARDYGPGLLTGLARINGQAVGITANDSHYYAGAMTAAAAQKMRRMIEFCDTFHLPLVNFVDEPGFMIGLEAEHAATIRFGMAAVAAAAEARTPWASIRIRKCYGVAGAAHFGPHTYVLDWPSVESGPLPLEGGVAVAYRREIAAAADPAAKREELETRLAAMRSSLGAAESFAVDDLIDPRETRPLLCEWVGRIQPQLDSLNGQTGFTLRP